MTEIKTKKLNLTEIHTNPDNPRTITEKAMENLVKSLQDFPEMMKLREIVVDETMTVLGGNMRLLALQKSGAKDCTAKIVSGLTPEQKREFVIKDNAAFGEWDMDALANAWSDLPLSEWGLPIPEGNIVDGDTTFEDDFDADTEAEKIEEPISKPGDIWLLGRHRLTCGDATKPEDIERLMDGKVADMVWTDPPYGVDYTDKNNFLNNNRTGHAHKKIIGDELRKVGLLDLLSNAFNTATNHLRPGGCVYVAHADINTAQFRTAMEQAGIKISQTVIWVKNSAVLSRNDYNWRHEPIIYGWKEGAGHFFCQDFTQNTVIDDQADPDSMRKDELLALVKQLKEQIAETVIRVNRPQKNDLHPTMKPIALVARMIRNSTDFRKNEIVLDPFGGSGTTLMACEQTNRTGYLCELDPVYCDVIKLRWEQFTGEEGKLLV